MSTLSLAFPEEIWLFRGRPVAIRRTLKNGLSPDSNSRTARIYRWYVPKHGSFAAPVSRRFAVSALVGELSIACGCNTSQDSLPRCSGRQHLRATWWLIGYFR